MTPSLSTLLENPAYLPHQLDLARGELLFLHCDPARVAQAAFIDGRTDVGTDAPVAVPLTVLPEYPASDARHRYLFHIGFCGSTLLSRLIDMPERVRVLREPNILADLANYRAMLDRRGDQGGAAGWSFDRLFHQIATLLHRPWACGETIVVKPSNWANNLLPSIAGRNAILTMGREDFLRAVFRGGDERLAFAARAAVHLSSRGRQGAEQVATALAMPGDDRDRLAALAIVLHHIQMRAFADRMAHTGMEDDHHIRWRQLAVDPATQVRRAAQALQIDLPEPVLTANLDRWAGQNAKAPTLAYSPVLQQAADRRAQAAQGDRIARALDWAEGAIGPEPE